MAPQLHDQLCPNILFNGGSICGRRDLRRQPGSRSHLTSEYLISCHFGYTGVQTRCRHPAALRFMGAQPPISQMLKDGATPLAMGAQLTSTQGLRLTSACAAFRAFDMAWTCGGVELLSIGIRSFFSVFKQPPRPPSAVFVLWIHLCKSVCHWRNKKLRENSIKGLWNQAPVRVSPFEEWSGLEAGLMESRPKVAFQISTT
ncbi:hypothetical protein B0H12DRAFT_1083211 [Mycena haematopus]|nr:hypothetical protein B0H12DRAFT_1083211 [Mycena haematopus]